ncbi:MAG: TPM domain-containing protein [Erysipelotrichaceae bacterium]|nr:TPM domain-containing protein [Erysipelotrichaceae bacterium]
MRKICKAILLLLCIALFSANEISALKADGQIIIDDEEDLLSNAEEEALRRYMEPISEYGGVAFVTVSQYGDTSVFAKNQYRELFGKSSGFLFLIDMGRRNIWIYSDGTIYKTINKAYANTITDNVYRYATQGEYFECARSVYEQALILLEGGHIAQPMKHISNALIALVLALLLNFAFLLIQRREERVPIKEIAAAMTTATAVSILSKKKTKSKRHLHVESDSSGGGGYSGGGGGGGGGGGSSGGGGGHSF